MTRLFNCFSLGSYSYGHIFLLIAVVHVITAFFSAGFLHFDEHFQIFEFLSFKNGTSGAADLPWEFHQEIRPWFQVMLYWLILKPLKYLGDLGPFIEAAYLRVATSFITLLSLYSLVPYLKNLLNHDDNKVKSALCCLGLTWFVPLLHARANSENLACAFLLIGFSFVISALDQNSCKKAFLAGLFLGAAYLVKAQFAVAVAFLWFGIFFFHKNYKVLIASSLAILVTIGVGILCDYWGYGHFVFTPWNYFNINIIQDKVSHFGVDPWWYYLRKSLLKGIPPISILLIVGTFVYWFQNKKTLLTWMTLPFFVIHCFIGHKELRFIYPVLLLAPLLSYLALASIGYRGKKYWLKLCYGVNTLLLLIIMFKPAHSAIALYRFIHQEKIIKLKAQDEDPFRMLGLNLNFYRPKSLIVDTFVDEPKNEEGYIFLRSITMYKNFLYRKNCRALYTAYPAFIFNLSYLDKWLKRSRMWSIFLCQKSMNARE